MKYVRFVLVSIVLLLGSYYLGGKNAEDSYIVNKLKLNKKAFDREVLISCMENIGLGGIKNKLKKCRDTLLISKWLRNEKRDIENLEKVLEVEKVVETEKTMDGDGGYFFDLDQCNDKCYKKEYEDEYRSSMCIQECITINYKMTVCKYVESDFIIECELEAEKAGEEYWKDSSKVRLKKYNDREAKNRTDNSKELTEQIIEGLRGSE